MPLAANEIWARTFTRSLTTQAQRPGARDATIATVMRWQDSLQRMVRRSNSGVHKSLAQTLTYLIAHTHQNLSEHVLAAPVAAIGPIAVILGVLYKLRIAGR